MVPKVKIAPIHGEGIRLRLLLEKDLPMTLGWRNKERIRVWFKSSNLLEFENHSIWFHDYQQRENDFLFVIEVLEDSIFKPVGQVGIYDIDYEKMEGEFGRLMIGEDSALGKGYAARATKSLLEFFRTVHHLKSFKLEVKADNKSAIRIYESVGFQAKHKDGNLLLMMLS